MKKFFIKKPSLVQTPRTPAQAAKAQKKKIRWQEAHPNLKALNFVIDMELWEEFEARYCSKEHGPNVLFTRWIRHMVEKE